MKDEFRDDSSPRVEHKDLDLSVRLHKSCVALDKLEQIHKTCEQRLAAADKELAVYAQANEFLLRKLMRIEKNAVDASYLAYHDALTGLPNRRLLLDRLNQAIAQAARQTKHAALVFFDVDGFKEINDTLGHVGADKLLQAVAQRLATCLRAADTACHYGENEFIVLLPEIDGEFGVTVVEQKIRDQLTAAYLIDGATIRIALNIGTAVYPIHARDHRDLIRLADTALYRSKTNGNTLAGGLTIDRKLIPNKS